jgi:hypothetical protein
VHAELEVEELEKLNSSLRFVLYYRVNSIINGVGTAGN